MSKLNVEQLQVVRARPRVFGGRLGRVIALPDTGAPVVDYPGNPLGPQSARAVTAMAGRLDAAWRQNALVLLVFEEDDAAKPVIVDTVMEEGVDRVAQPGGGVQAAAECPERETGADRDEPPQVWASSGQPSPGEPSTHEPSTHEPSTHEPSTHELSTREPADPLAIPGSDSAVGIAQIAATVASIVGVEEDGVLIRGPEPGAVPVKAKTAITLRNMKDPVVVLMLPAGQPVVIGQLHDRVPIDPAGAEGAEVVLKGSHVRIEADVELILQAGACQLKLDARGKAAMTADQIVSRARDTNKVQGGSVQLN